MSLVVFPRMVLIDPDGQPRVAATAEFFEPLTDFYIETFTTSAYTVSHPAVVTATASGYFPQINVNPAVNPTYKLVLKDADGQVIHTDDNLSALSVSASDIGVLLYPETTAETTVGVTIVNPLYPPGHVYRYGTNTTPGTTDMTAAIQAAINVMREAGGGEWKAAPDLHMFSSTINVKSYTHFNGVTGESSYPATLTGGGTAETGTRFKWGGSATSIAFTASVGGATSGTLTAAIANGVYNFTFYNSTTPKRTCEQRKVTVTGGTACSWTTALAAGTITTGISGAGVMFRCFSARMFSLHGLTLDGNNVAGTVCILLDSDNNPSGSQNEISSFHLRRFSIGVQWGTSGIANGSYANDGTRFTTFTAWSDVANSIGFVLNSGNAAQMSTIESGGIQVDLLGIDVKICNQLQIRRVFVGGRVTLAGVRTSVAIDVLMEGCDFENHGPSGGLISASSYSLLVNPQVETYPMTECVLTLKGNKFNNPVTVDSAVRILDLGNSWGSANSATFPAVTYIPSTGIFTSGVSLLVAINAGVNTPSTYGWVTSAFVKMTRISPDGGITFSGSITGYTDELASLSTTGGGQLGISTQMTSSPSMIFDHRGTGNTGVFVWRNGTGGSTTVMAINGTGQLSLAQLPPSTTYANDAAAAAGGVAVGQIYRNGSVVQVRVV